MLALVTQTRIFKENPRELCRVPQRLRLAFQGRQCLVFTLQETLLRMEHSALTGVAQWIECEPVNQRVAGAIPSRGTCLGCRPGPR